MLTLLLCGVVVAVSAEVKPSAAMDGLPVVQAPNMEGKEVRFGLRASATWAAMTTGTSNGSVNSMHDSLNPLAGMVPMTMMMLNVVFSGVGAGFENMLMYVIVAVFLAGLMVGRTPEYLRKKVEAKEVKLAMLAILLHPLLICCGAGLFAATALGQGDRGQSRLPRVQRDPLRVQLGGRQQRFGVRGPGRQQPSLEHCDGYRLASGPVPGLDPAAGGRRVPLSEEAYARRPRGRCGPTT